MKIIVDTREKLPLKFRIVGDLEAVISKKLDVGDYSIEGYENKISLDRKSACDLFGTLGKGHARFKKELERAKDYDFFGIIIEDSFTNIRDKNFENAHRTKMRGDVIIKILNTLLLKYNVHVFFCNNRNESSSLLRNLFSCYIKLKEVGDGTTSNLELLKAK